MDNELSKMEFRTLDDVKRDLEGKGPEELVSVVTTATRNSIDEILMAATAYHQLETMGEEDRVDLPPKMKAAYRKIGGGFLDAKAFAVFGHMRISKKLDNLSLSKQRQIADGEPVPIYSFHDGKPQKRMLSLMLMDADQRDQVLGENGIRSAGEQRSYLEKRKEKEKQKRAQKAEPVVEVVNKTRKRGILVRVGGNQHFISHDELARYAGETAK